MADENDDIDETEGDEAAPKKKLPIKMLLFIGLPVIILLLGGIGAFMMFAGGGEDEVQHAEAGHAETDDGHGTPARDSHAEASHETYFLPLFNEETGEDAITTNIRSTDGRSVIVRLRITLEVSQPGLRPVIDENIDAIMDQFISFLRELREDDLYGSAGMHRVKLELLRRVNLAIEPAHIDAVLIQEFMIVD